jgi:hypothetical protein
MSEVRKLTQKEIMGKLEKEWDFEKLLEPYRKGGPSKDKMIKRTWGTIVDWLINKRKFPPEIVGAAIFLVWMKIKKDGHFKADNGPDGMPIWDSAGNKFVQTLRAMCAGLMQQKSSQEIFSGMAGKIQEEIKTAFRYDYWSMMPWFVKMWSGKYWRHRKAVKKTRVKKDG